MNDERFSGAEYDRLIKPIMITAKIISIWPLAEDSSKRAVLFRRFHLFCMFFLVSVGVKASRLILNRTEVPLITALSITPRFKINRTIYWLVRKKKSAFNCHRTIIKRVNCIFLLFRNVVNALLSKNGTSHSRRSIITLQAIDSKFSVSVL